MYRYRRSNLAVTAGIACGLAFLFGLYRAAADEPPRAVAAHTAITPVQREDEYARKRCAELDERVKHGPFELVFLGDSITQGWEGAGAEVWKRHFGDYRALNIGVSGDRTQHVLWRLDHGHFDDMKPELIVLMIGTNNSNRDDNTVTEIADGVRAIVARLRAKSPDSHILLLDIFPRGETPNPQRGKNCQVNQIIARLDDGEHVHYRAIGHKFLDDSGRLSKDIMPDFLHLSERGYQIWAEAIHADVARFVGESAAAP